MNTIERHKSVRTSKTPAEIVLALRDAANCLGPDAACVVRGGCVEVFAFLDYQIVHVIVSVFADPASADHRIVCFHKMTRDIGTTFTLQMILMKSIEGHEPTKPWTQTRYSMSPEDATDDIRGRGQCTLVAMSMHVPEVVQAIREDAECHRVLAECMAGVHLCNVAAALDIWACLDLDPHNFGIVWDNLLDADAGQGIDSQHSLARHAVRRRAQKCLERVV